MKIVVYCENYRKGGLDTFAVNLMNELDVESIKFIVNSDHDGLSYLKNQLNCEVDVLNLIGRNQFFGRSFLLSKKNILTKVISLLIYIFSFPITFFKLIFTFRKYKGFDKLIIINGGFPGGDSCKIAALAWFVSKQGGIWYNFHNDAVDYISFLKPFQEISDKVLSSIVDGFISVSENCLETLNRRTAISNKNRYVVYNGIKAIEIGSELLRDDLSLLFQDGRKKIIMLGTFEKRKGHEFIFKAMEKLPDYDLIVCGKGTEDETDRLLNLTKGSNNIHLVGYVETPNLMIAKSDVLVVPSESNESFGLTIVEAMQLKVPVVATSTGGMKEVIKHNVDGILVEFGNVGKLQDSIISLIEDLEFKNRIVDSAYNSFNCKYRSDVMANKYKNIIGDENKL